jgi:HAD superfamily hydrolase (TIGR01509 family)
MLGHPAPPKALGRQIYDMVQTNLGRGITAMPGAVEIAQAAAGTRPIGIASNTPREIVIGYLDHIGLTGTFDVVIGSDDVTHPKPAPDTYLAACAHLSLNPTHTIAFEDSAVGVQAARSAGLRVIGVPSSPGLELDAHHVIPSLDDPWLYHTLSLHPNALARRCR